jgi:type II secretory pathway component GspD/PulD (secretin)
MKHPGFQTILLLCFSLGFFGLCFAASADEEVVQIRIVHRDVRDLLTMVQPLVSPYGHLSADVPSNSLIVIDNPAAVARIRALVSRVDAPVPQLKVRIEFGFRKSEQDQSVSVRGEADLGDVAVGVDQEKGQAGIDVTASSESGQWRKRSEYTIMVQSGSTAHISSRHDVPYPERWLYLSQGHGHIGRTVVFRKVDTGFDVRPVLVGDTVQIEIIPRISYVGERGLRNPIRFAEAATRLYAPVGEWVEIAGSEYAQAEMHRQILGGVRSSEDEQLAMRLLVTHN